MSRTQNTNNSTAQAQTQAKVSLNFAKVSDTFLSDMNTVLESIRNFALCEKTFKDARDAYKGDIKSEEFRSYIAPYRKDKTQAQNTAQAQARKFIAFYGQDRSTLNFDASDAVIDINAFLSNIGALQGDISDIKKDKQLSMLKGIMDTITGRKAVSVTRRAKTNNTIKFGKVRIVDDNVIDTILMLELGLTVYTCLKSYYVSDSTLYATVDSNGTITTVNRDRQARTLVNTVKNPVKAQDSAQA